jgi:hypothetical protein
MIRVEVRFARNTVKQLLFINASSSWVSWGLSINRWALFAGALFAGALFAGAL